MRKPPLIKPVQDIVTGMKGTPGGTRLATGFIREWNAADTLDRKIDAVNDRIKKTQSGIKFAETAMNDDVLKDNATKEHKNLSDAKSALEGLKKDLEQLRDANVANDEAFKELREAHDASPADYDKASQKALDAAIELERLIKKTGVRPVPTGETRSRQAGN